MNPNYSLRQGVRSTKEVFIFLQCFIRIFSFVRRVKPQAFVFRILLRFSLRCCFDILLSINAIIQIWEILINFEQFLTSIIFYRQHIMRKKYQNTTSQPVMKQLFEGFHVPSHNQVQPQASQMTPNRSIVTLQNTNSVKQLKMQRANERNRYDHKNSQNTKKISSQMDKMQGWMTDIYNKRKNQRQLNKNSNSNLDCSNLSIGSASSFKLPAINSPPAYFNSNDESKLVEQIRRVQNKIKQLRFQRNLAQSQQQKYEMLRPFIELQNQNMMNMQYMMMQQQNRGHQHHCCNRSLNNQTKIMHIPFPQQSQVNPQLIPFYQPPMGYPQNSTFMPFNNQNSTKNTYSSQNKKKIYNFKKIKKFRVAVIAVYFSLLFPKFVNRFTKKRFQLHSKKYFNKKEPHHTVIITKAIDILSDINFYQISKNVQEHRKEKEIRRVTKSKTAKLVISEQYGQSKNYEIYLGDLQVYLLVLLKKLHEIIQQGILDGVIQEVGVGNLPYSFPIDHNYLQQQIYRLKFHPQKIYLECNQLQSKALLMVTFFVKLLIYDFLFVIRQDFQWKNQLLKKNNLKKNKMIEAQMVATQMYISGILLHRYCMDILTDQVKDIQGNVDKLDPKIIAVPMGMMAYQEKSDINQDKKKRKSQQKAVKQGGQKRGSSNSQQQEYRINQFQYIKKLDQFQSLMQEIIEKSGHNEEVKQKISDIIDEIFKKSIKSRDLEYKQITSRVLSQDKYFFTKRLGVEKNFFEMPARNSQQKNEIKQLIKQIKQTKKLQNPNYEDGSYKKGSQKLTMRSKKYIQNRKNKLK